MRAIAVVLVLAAFLAVLGGCGPSKMRGTGIGEGGEGPYGGPEITGEIIAMRSDPPNYNVVIRMRSPSSGYLLTLDSAETKPEMVIIYVTVEPPVNPAAESIAVVQHEAFHSLGLKRPAEVRILARTLTQKLDPEALKYKLVSTID